MSVTGDPGAVRAAAATLRGLAQRLPAVLAPGDQAVSTMLANARGGFPAEIAQWWDRHVGQASLANPGYSEHASRALIDFLNQHADWLDSVAAAMQTAASRPVP